MLRFGQVDCWIVDNWWKKQQLPMVWNRGWLCGTVRCLILSTYFSISLVSVNPCVSSCWLQILVMLLQYSSEWNRLCCLCFSSKRWCVLFMDIFLGATMSSIFFNVYVFIDDKLFIFLWNNKLSDVDFLTLNFFSKVFPSGNCLIPKLV